jgi:CHAT domain
MTSVLTDGELIDWIDTPSAGARVNGGDGPRDITFDPGLWKAASARLVPDSAVSYQKLGGDGDFGRWWLDKCGGDFAGVRRFRVRMPAPEWERPWEGIVSSLDRSRWKDVSIVRQTQGDDSPRQPSELDEPLQILCLQGANSGPNLDALDLDAEFAGLLSVYNGLNLSTRNSVKQPIVAKAETANLESLLREHRPSVLWFSGHARPNPPGLLLHDNHWLTPTELAEAIQKVVVEQGRTPLYVVLWACDTGSAKRFSELVAAPPFIDALGDCGISALLASQAPLADRAARQIAAQVFIALAAGRPIDHGVARARAELMRLADEELLKNIDWLCPVVWCKGAPPQFIKWKDGRELNARWQDAARKLLPSELAELLGNSQNTPDQVSTWPAGNRLWISSAVPEGIATRATWAQKVLAKQWQSEKTVLWFSFSSGQVSPPKPHMVLQDWANLALARTEQDDDPKKTIRMAAEKIKEDPESGWRSICSNNLFIIGMIEPPESDPQWLWDALRQNPETQAIVLAHEYPAERVTEDWRVDSLNEYSNPLPTSDLNALAALAVLGQPAARHDIELAANVQLMSWIDQSVVLDTAAGCIVPAGLAERIAGSLEPDARSKAHRLAYKFLDGPVARRKIKEGRREDLLRARWRHAQAAMWPEAIQNEGTSLLKLYYQEHRIPAFLDIFENSQITRNKLPKEVVVHASWFYLDKGDPGTARSWLETVQPEELEPTFAASWYAAFAEVEKESGRPGSKEAAKTNLEEALAEIKDENSEYITRQRLNIQHDMARLIQFFGHQPAEMAKRYEELLTEWEAIPYSDLDRAITCRNLAEALMDTNELEMSEKRIVQARKLLPEWTRHVVCAELEYLAGRLAVRRKLDRTEIRRRFDVCRQKALDTNHLMMDAIVESRIFWLDDLGQTSPGDFDDAAWDKISRYLVLYRRHAWACRVLIDGRLKAAHRTSARGERGIARKELSDAFQLLEANPAFDDGSDLRRIVATYAGLALFDTPTDWWRRLKENFTWAQEWLTNNNADDPDKAWEQAG